MKKLKYQGGITKRICQQIANRNKSNFTDLVKQKKIQFNYPSTVINYDVISFSGASGIEDQIFSIYTFVYHAGAPDKWTIYSDGSYTETHTQLLKSYFPFIEVAAWDSSSINADNQILKDYLKVSSMAKKARIISSHEYRKQTIYIDSDILFYTNITAYLNNHSLQSGFWYVPDTWGNVKEYLNNTEYIYPINAGFLILNAGFDFGYFMEYLERLEGKYSYFSEQSAFEYALRKQNAQPLDPRQFIIDTGDQFDFETKYHPSQIALRHYTGPVRHKMWQRGWKWHLQK